MKKIKKCKCGSTRFTVFENSTHDGNVDADGILYLSHQETEGFGKVICDDCSAEYSTDNFKSVEW